MSIIRRLVGLVMLEDALRLSHQQDALIRDLTRELRRRDLAYCRHLRDLIEQFLIVLDQPEHHDAVRAKMAAALSDLSDQVAREQEHVI